jgi:Zn-dependent M28 family amino/carboxypeptidase
VPLQKSIADLNLDMIGRDEDTYRAKPEEHRNSVNVLGTLYSPQLRTAIERANASVGLTLDYKMDKDDSENLFGRSDHYAFAFYSVPAVLYSTGFHGDYHTSRDTWDRLNYEKMAKIARLAFLTSLDLANTAEQPKFVE